MLDQHYATNFKRFVQLLSFQMFLIILYDLFQLKLSALQVCCKRSSTKDYLTRLLHDFGPSIVGSSLMQALTQREQFEISDMFCQ